MDASIIEADVETNLHGEENCNPPKQYSSGICLVPVLLGILMLTLTDCLGYRVLVKYRILVQ